jgi:hypothetical protein
MIFCAVTEAGSSVKRVTAHRGWIKQDASKPTAVRSMSTGPPLFLGGMAESLRSRSDRKLYRLLGWKHINLAGDSLAFTRVCNWRKWFRTTWPATDWRVANVTRAPSGGTRRACLPRGA